MRKFQMADFTSIAALTGYVIGVIMGWYTKRYMDHHKPAIPQPPTLLSFIVLRAGPGDKLPRGYIRVTQALTKPGRDPQDIFLSMCTAHSNIVGLDPGETLTIRFVESGDECI